ncbi:MAG: sugar ABC transporter permease [Clostridia bacterium]|nr:sugar ABC transporter permease [Clostridia bacterium]
MKQKMSRIGRPSSGQWGFMLLFGLPPFLLFTFVTVVPMISSAYQSFFDYSGYGDMTWVGLDNYRRILTDPIFGGAVVNDVIILFFKVIIVLVLAVTFAVSLTRLNFGHSETNVLRFVYYIPNILSSVVIAKVWKYFFDLELFSLVTGLTTPENGWVSTYPLPIIIFVASWCGIGAYMVILIAAINNISKELYEAAEMDGAGQFRQLFSITLPAILPQVRYIAISMLTSIIGSNMNFVKLFLGESMHGSGFTVMGVYEYDYAFSRYELGYANAAAVILMAIVIALSYVFNYVITRKEKS